MAFLKRLNTHFRSKSSATDSGFAQTRVAETSLSDFSATSIFGKDSAVIDGDRDPVRYEDAQVAAAPTGNDWEFNPPLNRANAKARVDAMRKALLPQPAEQMKGIMTVGTHEPCVSLAKNHLITTPIQEEDAHVQKDLSVLQTDILWASVIPIKIHGGSTACHHCGSDFSFPKEFGWRLHSCGHYYHVSCFRDFVLAAAVKEQKAVQQPCLLCENLHRQFAAFNPGDIRARTQRLEAHLLYYKVDCYGAGAATEQVEAFQGDVPNANDGNSYPGRSGFKLHARLSTLCADVEDRKQRHRSAAQVQKQAWRKSIPAGADMDTLEHAWKLNSNHPIFEGLSKLDKDRFFQRLKELDEKLEETRTDRNETSLRKDNLTNELDSANPLRG
ncbi:uncharacterized protein EI97DRAFT_439722 [Westerdykella ornata]|uniref:RING-type domain-containing protein n=1 Tax=Westerdykella ornata TaxID=318751 RepID=A0A6A6JWB7_WESOR|nr:uncharacterized protein EI97DRAFT_439722 [Westerdykella ornata]KAF2279359.1 hypothetical protein EI97DRAFT_439722 [Westerdykella ornata]